MSRGPGRWQRALLDAVAEYDVVSVADVAESIVGREPTRSELVAIRRAAAELAKAGALRATYVQRCRRCGAMNLVMAGQCLPPCRGSYGHALVVTPITSTLAGPPRGWVSNTAPTPEWISVPESWIRFPKSFKRQEG